MQSKNPIIDAHKHCSSHRQEITTSKQCGCFYCLSIFKPEEIVEWVDEINGLGTTAICPRCGVDSVIGSQSGFPLTQEFLKQLHNHWFA
jgi:hypothetical protein